MAKMYLYCVDASYRLHKNFHETDKELFRIAGRSSDASGAGRTRDHSWWYKTKSAAYRAAKKLRDAKFTVSVTMFEK